MARLPNPGSDDGKWGDILNDYLSQAHTSDGLLRADSVGSVQLQDGAVAGAHLAPGAVTKASIGLGQVDNTADNAKPVSTATQSALDGKMSTAALDAGVAGKILDSGSDTRAALSAQIGDSVAPLAPRTMIRASARVFGMVVGFGGDSITVGTGSTAGKNRDFPRAIRRILGSARVSAASVFAGVAGNTSAQLLARFQADVLDQNPDVAYVMIGTNDAGSAVSVSDYLANLASIKALCDAAGKPLVLSTVPPRGDSTTANGYVKRYNLALRFWAPAQGIPLADAWAAIVDSTTGNPASGMISGDGIHPSDAGHLAIAGAAVSALSAFCPAPVWPAKSAGHGLAADPLMTGLLTRFAGTSSTIAAMSNVAAAGGDLPAGQWCRTVCDNSAGGATIQPKFGQQLSTGFSVGDTLLFCAYVRAVGTLPNADEMEFDIMDNSHVVYARILRSEWPNLTPGPLMAKWVVPSGWSGVIKYGWRGVIPVGRSLTVDTGAMDVFNLTTLGIDGVGILPGVGLASL